MSTRDKAKGIERSGIAVGRTGESVGPPLDDFRSSLGSELSASLERALRLHKAETIAAEIDRKRSTLYRWVAHPEDVPLCAIPVLARFDPDPEFVPRLVGHLTAMLGARALAARAAGHTTRIIVEEIGPGRWGRRS